MIHLYTGDGKGKTTAALGLALRAAGHCLKTLIIQFLKSENCGYGEHNSIRLLYPYVEIFSFGRECFVEKNNPTNIIIYLVILDTLVPAISAAIMEQSP